MGNIQTGVDRLVALIKEKEKISIDEAAKTLGVSKINIQEWADFLEEEGIIEIKYGFADDLRRGGRAHDSVGKSDDRRARHDKARGWMV